MKQVELIDLTKSYDKQKNVLNEISLSIEKGEFFCTSWSVWLWQKHVVANGCGT